MSAEDLEQCRDLLIETGYDTVTEQDLFDIVQKCIDFYSDLIPDKGYMEGMCDVLRIEIFHHFKLVDVDNRWQIAFAIFDYYIRPTLYKHKPNTFYSYGYWFDFSEDAKHKRIDILNKIQQELCPSLTANLETLSLKKKDSQISPTNSSSE